MQYSASLNVPRRYAVESLPFLKHPPNALAPWKKDVRVYGNKEAAASMALVDRVRQDLSAAKTQGADMPDSLQNAS